MQRLLTRPDLMGLGESALGSACSALPEAVLPGAQGPPRGPGQREEERFLPRRHRHGDQQEGLGSCGA